MDITKHVKIFADGADLDGILALYKNPSIKGFTTNPTLMRKAGISDYEAFARQLVAAIPDRPISFEVFCRRFRRHDRAGPRHRLMGRQRQCEDSGDDDQGRVHRPGGADARQRGRHRQRDRGHDRRAGGPGRRVPGAERPAIVPSLPGVWRTLAAIPCRSCAPRWRSPPARSRSCIWASPRELLNIFQADEIGCHIITVSHDVLAKLSLIGKDLDEYSLETVKMFHRDATAAGFKIAVPERRAAS